LPQHHTKASFPSAGPAAIIPTSLAPATSQQGDSFLSTSAMAQALPHSYTSAAESQAGTPSWLDATLLAHGLPMPAATTVTQGQSGSPRASALSGASGVSLPADLEELERMVARLDQQVRYESGWEVRGEVAKADGGELSLVHLSLHADQQACVPAGTLCRRVAHAHSVVTVHVTTHF
jgi:hypothetical protein